MSPRRAATTAHTLPTGLAVRIGRGVRIREGGRALLGGAPPRVSRLGERGRALLRDGVVTVTDAASETLALHLLGSGLAEPVPASLPPVSLSLVTVVIPVHNRAVELERVLSSLEGAMPVVLVDDRSADPLTTVRTGRRHGAGTVLLDRNQGPAAARNAGLARVETPYVLFVDTDVVITPPQVELLVRQFADPRVALVAPRILGLSRAGGVIGSYESVRSSLDRGPESALVATRGKVAWVPSAVLAGRVSALGGGFDADLRSGEDVDLVWRLGAEGWLVRYDAEVVARHDHLTGALDWARRKAFYGTSAASLAARHGGKVAPAVLTPLSAGVAVALLGQRRWAVALAAATAAVTTTRVGRAVGSRPLAAEIVARGVVDSAAQTSGLLLRHWWPAVALLAVPSRRVRRALLVAAVTDTVVTARRAPAGTDLLGFALARRADDLAYGAGVWLGAIRARSPRCLLPARP